MQLYSVGCVLLGAVLYNRVGVRVRVNVDLMFLASGYAQLFALKRERLERLLMNRALSPKAARQK